MSRYGVDLETFLDNPTGVTRLMLRSHLRLSAVDRDSILQVLKELYEDRRADADGPPRPGLPGAVP